MLTDSKSHIDVFPGQYLVNRFGRNRRKARVYNKGLLQSLSRQQAGKRGVDSNRHGMRQGRTKWHQRVRENGRAKGHKSRNKGLNNIIWPTMWRWRKRVKKRWRKTCSWCQKRFHGGCPGLVKECLHWRRTHQPSDGRRNCGLFRGQGNLYGVHDCRQKGRVKSGRQGKRGTCHWCQHGRH